MRVVGVVWGFAWVVGVHVGVGIHIGVVGGHLLFAGGRSSLSVDGASLWWAGGHCAWHCQHHPSALWAGVRGVVEKAIVGVPHQSLGGERCCHPSLFLGSWAFIIESVVVDVAHLDGHAMPAVWWWVSWSVSASLDLLTMLMTWVWYSPGIMVAMMKVWDGGG